MDTVLAITNSKSTTHHVGRSTSLTGKALHKDTADANRLVTLEQRLGNHGTHDKTLFVVSHGYEDQVVLASPSQHYGKEIFHMLFLDNNYRVLGPFNMGAEYFLRRKRHRSFIPAALFGDQDEVSQLLLVDKGPAIGVKILSKALQVAAYGGHDRVVQMLLDKGADVNAQGGEYGSALQAALYGGESGTVTIKL